MLTGFFQSAGMKSELSSDRYSEIKIGNLLIAAGTIIAIIENLVAIVTGLHHVDFHQALILSITVIMYNILFIVILFTRKRMIVWQEWLIFFVYFILYQVFYCVWEYRLGDLRLLAVINAITTTTILLSYLNVFQSALISVSNVLNYSFITWYAIKIAGQPGSLAREMLMSVCMIPAFIFITVVSWRMNKKKNRRVVLRDRLQKINMELREKNSELTAISEFNQLEMELASEVQKTLFPGSKPDVAGWDIAIISIQPEQVSGDFYDFYSKDGVLNGVSLFDVSGHGIAQALITIYAKPLIFRSFTENERRGFNSVIESAVTGLDEQLTAVNMYMTGVMLRFNGDKVEYINAGHPDIIHYSAKDMNCSVVSDNDGLFKSEPIGVTGTERVHSWLNLTSGIGDMFVLYSNGLIEIRNRSGETFGIKRLQQILSDIDVIDAEAVLNRVKSGLDEFSAGRKIEDDITVIIAIRKK